MQGSHNSKDTLKSQIPAPADLRLASNAIRATESTEVAGQVPVHASETNTELSWQQAIAEIVDISRGWLFIERDELCGTDEWHLLERELDAFGNEEQPRSLGFFRLPREAVEHAETHWRRQSP